MRSHIVGFGVLLALFGTSMAIAGTTPAKCAAVKQKAAGKKIAARLGCYSKAVAKTVPVDPDCLAKANTKFSATFAKADAAGGCTIPGDATAQELAADSAVATIAAAEAATPIPPVFGAPCGTTCPGPGAGMSALLCAGNIPAPPRPVCIQPPPTPSACTGPLDCELTMGPGFICVTTGPGCAGSRFCAAPCP
jgi:hypothetical protein